MRCFDHQESEAVAVCKHCGKGLCPDCLIERQGIVSCNGLCERQVAMQLYVLEKSVQAYRGAAWTYKALTAICLLLMPAAMLVGVFIALNSRLVATKEGFAVMMTAFAVSGICLLLAFITYNVGKSLTKKSKSRDALAPPSADSPR